MTGIYTWSTTAGNNVNANIGYTWDEGMSPASVNDSARSTLADIRTAFNDLAWFQYGIGAGAVGAVYSSGTVFTIAGVTAIAAWHVGRRVKAVGSSTGTIYGTISAASFGSSTNTITVVWDSGSLSNESLTVYLSQFPYTGNPVGTFLQTGLRVNGATAVPLTFKVNETLTAARVLSIVTGDSDRTLTLSANATIGGTISGTHSGTSSGTNTGDQTITLTGAIEGSGTGTIATTFGAGGVPVVLASGNLSTGTDTALAATLSSYTGYKRIEISFDNLLASVAPSLYLVFSTNAGSGYVGSGYAYAGNTSSGTTNTAFGSSSTSLIVLAGGIGSATLFSGVINLEAMNVASPYPHAFFQVAALSSTTLTYPNLTTGSGYCNNAATTNAIKIYVSTGTVTAGTYRIVGYP